MRKALVIEDVPEYADFIVAAFGYLQFAAFAVETVTDAIEALNADDEIEAVFISTCPESRIDLVNLATLIAVQWPQIQITVSSYEVGRLRDFPPCVFLTKPINPRMLISILEQTFQ
jgi:CheY-like chemotaxis protein